MAENLNGYTCVRFGDAPFRKRDEDAWPPLTRRLYLDQERNLSISIVWYGRGATEPRHVHNGTHATWLLIGSALMDGQTAGPCDVVYGPGRVPHGPLLYENGCMLFSVNHGGSFHTAVDGEYAGAPSDGLPAQLVHERDHEWQATVSQGGQWSSKTKTLLYDPARQYTAKMILWPAGSTAPRHVHPGFHANLIFSGSATVGGQTFGPWDLIYGPGDTPHGPIEFSEDCIMVVGGVGDLIPRAL
ncbi:MAG: hypothetical protein IT307_11915 [Chloroflexi bacterium]|nr:hypothetical protein [Chloroflexota bacterium]